MAVSWKAGGYRGDTRPWRKLMNQTAHAERAAARAVIPRGRDNTMSMRFLVLFAHPDPGSFDAALHRRTLDVLRGQGHDIDDCDLYAERFDPGLSYEERRKDNDEGAPQPEVASHIDRLRKAQG